MQIEGYRRSWQVNEIADLERALQFRDTRGGALFWMAREAGRYPCLAIRVSGDVADVTYFPREFHPGFRCLSGKDMADLADTTLVYEGCDPGTGEVTPRMFVVPFATAFSIAAVFLDREQMSDAVSWFEL